MSFLILWSIKSTFVRDLCRWQGQYVQQGLLSGLLDSGDHASAASPFAVPLDLQTAIRPEVPVQRQCLAA